MENNDVPEIKSRLDIVELVGDYLKLRKVGAGYQALCPFHTEKTPSFYVSSERQSFKCFGCGAYGDIFTFVMKMEGIEFREALKILAQRAGVKLREANPELKSERDKLFEICEKATQFFIKQLKSSQQGKKSSQYLLERSLTQESIKEWRLGYAPDTWNGLMDFLKKEGFSLDEIKKSGLVVQKENTQTCYDRFRGRIIFPITDLQKRVIGFGARVFDPEGKTETTAKYINSPTTLLYSKSNVLYGLSRAKLSIREKDQIILVEGYTDVIMSHQAGFLNTVAVSGTALTPYQLKMLKRYSNRLFTAFDMDQAGSLATQRSIKLAQEQGLLVRVIVSPKEGSDPAEIISQDPKQWEKAVQSAKTSMEFFFDIAFSQHSKETPEGRREITEMLIPLIASIDGQIEQAHWVQELSQKMGVDEKSIFQEMGKVSFEEEEEKEESLPEVSILSRKEKLERRILGLLLSRKEKKIIILKKDLDLFSPAIKKLIDLAQQGQIDKIKAKSRKVANFLNVLEVNLEREGIEEEKEIDICLRELKNLDTRTHLEEISKQICEAEQKNQIKKVQKLIEKFKKFGESLIDN